MSIVVSLTTAFSQDSRLPTRKKELECNILNRCDQLSKYGLYNHYIVKGSHQTSNFIARMVNGNRSHGIVNMHINIRSLFNKLSEIKVLIRKESPHILGVTEAELSKKQH